MNNKELKIKKNDMKRKSISREEYAKEFSPLSKKAHEIYQAENYGGLVTKELAELGEEIISKNPTKLNNKTKSK